MTLTQNILLYLQKWALTVTSETQTGLDCCWRILSFTTSYHMLVLGWRSTRAKTQQRTTDCLRAHLNFPPEIFQVTQSFKGFTRKQMAIVFSQLQGLSVQATRALVGFGHVSLPHALHVLPTMRVQENHHGMVLDIIQSFHRSGSNVQQGVFALFCYPPHRVQLDDGGWTFTSSPGDHF